MQSSSPSLALSAVLLFVCALWTPGQDRGSSPDAAAIRASAAYSEILLRRTELLAELDALTASYTETHPKILDLKAELAALDKDTDRVFGVKIAEVGKLTLGLGKLIVRKAALEADLARLSRAYSKEHPDVLRARKRVEIFETAISEVLK